MDPTLVLVYLRLVKRGPALLSLSSFSFFNKLSSLFLQFHPGFPFFPLLFNFSWITVTGYCFTFDHAANFSLSHVNSGV